MLTTRATSRKVLVFQKTSSKVSKTIKMHSDCHIKTCQSLKQKGNLKISSAVFYRNMSFYSLWNKTSIRKRFLVLRDKNHLTFCRKNCWKKQPSFLCLLNDSPRLYICTQLYNYLISSNKRKASNKHRTFGYPQWNKRLSSNKRSTSKCSAQ